MTLLCFHSDCCLLTAARWHQPVPQWATTGTVLGAHYRVRRSRPFTTLSTERWEVSLICFLWAIDRGFCRRRGMLRRDAEQALPCGLKRLPRPCLFQPGPNGLTFGPPSAPAPPLTHKRFRFDLAGCPSRRPHNRRSDHLLIWQTCNSGTPIDAAVWFH